MKLATAARRLLSAARGPIHSKPNLVGFCSHASPSPPNPLLARLLQVPTSQIKETLDSDCNFARSTPGFSWDALVTTLSSSSLLKAQLVLEWKLDRMMKNNEANREGFHDLISLCAKIPNVPLAMRVFLTMESLGIAPTTCVYNCLVHACLSSSEVLTALSLFQKMESSEGFKPDSETYDVFIAGFSGLRDVERMKAWFQAKREAGFDANVRNYEALVSGCVNAGDFDGVDGFYREMMASGVMPSAVVLECVVEGLCTRRRCDSVMEFLKFLLECRFEVNCSTVEKIVGLYIELGKVDELEKLLETLMLFYKDGDALLSAHCGIIGMYAALDRSDDAEYSVGRMMNQGMTFRSPGDVEKVISMYFRKEAYDSLDLFLDHIKPYYKLTRSTYDLLIAEYKRAGLVKKSQSLMEEMKLAGL